MATTAAAFAPPTSTNSHGFYLQNPRSPAPIDPYPYARPTQPLPPQQRTSTMTSPTSNTPPSSSSTSPSTARHHDHSRANHYSFLNAPQIRKPRPPCAPDYIPAALRATDQRVASRYAQMIPARTHGPDSPPTSKDNSFDSAKAGLSSPQTPGIANDIVAEPDASSLENGMDALRRSLSRAASEVLDEELGDVTGEPTTAHWKPDASSNKCAVCFNVFTFFFRRHHCRHCGEIVCDDHIRFRVRLDQNARFHPKGHPSKACNRCADEYRIVKKLRHSRAGSLAESQHSNMSGSGPLAGSARPAAIPSKNLSATNDNLRVGSMARSEGGMIWSTF